MSRGFNQNFERKKERKKGSEEKRVRLDKWENRVNGKTGSD